MRRQIRKFGLEYCDLPTMLWNVSVFLKVLTLNIYGKNKTGIPFICYIIMIIASMCYFYVYLFSVMWFVFVRSFETGNKVTAMLVLSLGVASEIGTLKLLYMFVNMWPVFFSMQASAERYEKNVSKNELKRYTIKFISVLRYFAVTNLTSSLFGLSSFCDKIRGLTDAFLDFDSRMTPGSRQATNLLRYLRDVKLRGIIYWGVIMGNAILYVFTPFVLTPSGRHLPEDLMVIYGLEPMLESPHYEIAWTMIAFSVFIVCYISANVTTYLILIIGYAESQILAMSDEVTHIWTDAEEHYKTVAAEFGNDNFLTNYDEKKRIMNDHVYKILKDIIKRHATIKTLLYQVEDVCSGPIAVGFTLLVLGLIVELLAGLENTILELPFAFMQVGIDCFIGQRVMDAGIVFEQTVYDCKWENFDKNNMKLVLVMLQASQKPTAISAGGVTKMSFRCLMAAMRATYSAYTALRTLMK